MQLATDLRLALSPVAFAEDVSGLDLDPWQQAVLRSGHRRIMLNCCRQSGKSTVSALIALHAAAYNPDSLALLLSPSLRQSSELFQVVKGFYRSIAGRCPCRQESALRMEFTNGSRVISLPGTEKTVRGYSGVDLLIVDEASRVPDDLYHAIRPMLAVSDGRLLLLSTPFGRRGFFHEAWTGPEPWERTKLTGEECPRISAEFLEEERRTMPNWFYRQEYLCEFEESESTIFDWDLVEEAARLGDEDEGIQSGQWKSS